MRKAAVLLIGWITLILTIALDVITADCSQTGDFPADLYGQSALLMDADTGRVLYQKNGYDAMPMASTTKIMTCMLAIESGRLSETVTFSKRAAAQPDVQLDATVGEQYILEDLLYPLMLASYNDVAVAVAEHVGGSVERFAESMNAKAKEIGCQDTHFVTPNGLDAEDQGGSHHTTAYDLALVLSYAIHDKTFLAITQTGSYTLHEVNGNRSETVANHNALLSLLPGTISGKTGFTGKAGYCYAGAYQDEGRTFIAVVLAAGWPPHKSYKWSDMQKLFHYGSEHYFYHDLLSGIPVTQSIAVTNARSQDLSGQVQTCLTLGMTLEPILLGDEERVSVSYDVPNQLTAPVQKGEPVGTVTLCIDDQMYGQIPLITTEDIQEPDFPWCVQQVKQIFCF